MSGEQEGRGREGIIIKQAITKTDWKRAEASTIASPGDQLVHAI